MIAVFSEEYSSVMTAVARAVLRHFGNDEKDVYVEISSADEGEIRTLNRTTRDIDKVTDVLSYQNLEDVRLPLKKEDYPTEINAEDDSIILGEIFICLQKAKEQADEYGHSMEREIAFLTCHGMLHLLGYDHQTEAEEKEMFALTEEILGGIGYFRDRNEPIRGEKPADEFRSGFVAIMGRPNAGKSTLINAIVGEKVAIVSWKPQTTRNKILGIYNEPNTQIVFIDTPGLHKPRNTLGEYMMKSAKAASEGVDCLLYVIDAEKGFDESDKQHVRGFLSEGEKVIAVVNKIDHVTKEKVFSILTELKEYKELEAVVPISALKKRNVEPLMDEIKKRLTDHIKYYDDDLYTNRNMRFMVAEIIREKALRLLDKEVPYGIGVDVTEYTVRESDGLINVTADVICEKAAHKPIVLGKGGEMIKKISTYARQDIEDMTGSKVFIKLFVKVRDEWRGSPLILKELGYDPKNPD